MKNTTMLTIRNLNILVLLSLFMGLFLISKQNCIYYILLALLGTDLLIQGSSIIWLPDLFVYFTSVGEFIPTKLPNWKDCSMFTKMRLLAVSLFLLFTGYSSLHYGLVTLNRLGCI